MTQSKTELFNLAAQVLGARGRLVSTTARSRYIDVFELWYPPVRKHVFSAAYWPSTAKFLHLTLSGERLGTEVVWSPADPAPGFKYSFGLPADMLRPRFLSSGRHFSMHMQGDKRVLNTSEQSPLLHYTFDNTDISSWENTLYMSVAYAIAAETALALTGKPSYVQLAAQKANRYILEARALAANEEEDQKITAASWHTARGFFGAPDPVRYLYPHGELVDLGVSASVG